jgi:hypothetical protein
VTGRFTTSTSGSVYIQPNGDGVHNGQQGVNLLNRPLSFQCGKSGVSAGSGGPVGHALQTLVDDGSAAWCFVPEYKSYPGVVPGTPIDPFPAIGFGGPFGISGAAYMTFAYPAMAVCKTGGLKDADAAYTNIDAIMKWYLGGPGRGETSHWTYAIAP